MVIYLGRRTLFIMNENIVSASKLSKLSPEKIRTYNITKWS